MRLPWQECSHDKIHIKRIDHGIDGVVIVTCTDCGEVVAEHMVDDWKSLLGEDGDDATNSTSA